MKTKILRAYKMTNGGGVTKNQNPVEQQRPDRKELIDYLADAIEIISDDAQTLDKISAHLELMNQTLQGIAGDIAQINTRQLAAFEIIKNSIGTIEVTDINDIETPGENAQNDQPDQDEPEN